MKAQHPFLPQRHLPARPVNGSTTRPTSLFAPETRSSKQILAAALALAAAVALMAAAPVQAQERIDTALAQQALARGAVVWDLRASGPVLPGAARVSPQALQAWLVDADAQALSQAVSAVGLNLSAEVVLVAEDDAAAQALAERLQPLVRGRLAWLAGGTAGWQAAGLALQAQPTQRLPVPQRLSPASPSTLAVQQRGALADASRRGTVTVAAALGTPAATGVQASAWR